MTWEKHEPKFSGGTNARYAVYSETVSGVHDKTLDVSADLGRSYVVRPTFIEINYDAFAGGDPRVLELVITRDGIDIHTLRLDKEVLPQAGGFTRVYLVRGRGAVHTRIEDGVPTFIHVMAPFVLSPGDALRIHAVNGLPEDEMSLFFHCETLSRNP